MSAAFRILVGVAVGFVAGAFGMRIWINAGYNPALGGIIPITTTAAAAIYMVHSGTGSAVKNDA